MGLWGFKNSSWIQDELSGSFALNQIEGVSCASEIAAPLELLVGAKLHPATGECQGKTFPKEFAFCPECGVSLVDLTKAVREPWVPPYGSGLGTKIFAKALKPDAMVTTSGQDFPLPSSSGQFAFLSTKFGGVSRMLVAFQRDVGQVWVYRPNEEKKWKALEGRAGDCFMPSWAWALATSSSETGFAVPVERGQAWLKVDWANNQINVEVVEGEAIGSPVRVGKSVAAPLIRNGAFTVMVRREGDETWSESTTSLDPAVVGMQLQRCPEQKRYAGIPLVDESRGFAYWPLRGGYVRVAGLDGSDAVTWDFRPWENDSHPATALIEIGPAYRKTGNRSGYWQLCVDHDPNTRDGVVNKLIKIDGDINADSEVVEGGQFLTSGRASFSWLYDYWDDVHKRSPGTDEQSELRYPLLQFGDKGLALLARVRPWEGREDLGLFSELLYTREQRATTFVRLVIQGAGVPERALTAIGVDGADGFGGSFFKISVAQLAEISVFIYEENLYVYFPEDNRCFRWPVELAEA